MVVVDVRPLVARRGGARELTVEVTVEVDFVVTVVIMLVSLSSSSDCSEGGDGTVLRLRLGDDCAGLETGTADAERRVPAVDALVARGISGFVDSLSLYDRNSTRFWAKWFVYTRVRQDVNRKL